MEIYPERVSTKDLEIFIVAATSNWKKDDLGVNTIRKRILSRISEEKCSAYVTSEFKDYGSPSQISRCLRDLVEEKKLIRVGVGIYTPARISSRTGNETPIYDVMDIAVVALRKLGIEAEYNAQIKRMRIEI